MGFFDDVPSPPVPEIPIPKYSPWQGPPPGWLGGWVPWHEVLIKSEDVCLTFGDVAAFPEGLSFTFTIRIRPSKSAEGTGDPMAMRRFFQPGAPREGGFRFGFGFADGRKATIGWDLKSDEPTADKPILRPRGGNGSPWERSISYWLWPLPPPGPLLLVISWEEFGIPEQSTELDASALARAAECSEKLWDVKPEDLVPPFFAPRSSEGLLSHATPVRPEEGDSKSETEADKS